MSTPSQTGIGNDLATRWEAAGRSGPPFLILPASQTLRAVMLVRLLNILTSERSTPDAAAKYWFGELRLFFATRRSVPELQQPRHVRVPGRKVERVLSSTVGRIINIGT